MKRLLPTALLILSLLCGCQRTTEKRLIVLGIDGCDPVLLKRFMDQGKLPNFTRLKDLGSFQSLGTSNPPQSPVAWATFTTGLDPGGHGIFDFIHRDPKTMEPVTSMSDVDEQGRARLLRHGQPFWEYLVDAGIPATLVKMPAKFPPEGLPGQLLTGMGTPDLEGTYGTFSYYTAADEEPPEELSGGRFVPVVAADGLVKTSLMGPGEDRLPLRVNLDGDSALLEVSGQKRLLKKGEWSDWVPLDFPSAAGIVRFYLKDTEPHLKLYASPVNLDPYAPAEAISSPEEFSRHLCRHCGHFYTQGMPEDTKALVHGVLDDGEFLHQNSLVTGEHRVLFEQVLSEFHSGLLFFYVSTPDILSHMYWNTIDPNHPGYTDERADEYATTIESAYEEADYYVGKALEEIDDNTTVLVLSDHGFAPFHRSFNLNGWLQEEGYLLAKPGSHTPEWARTKLYGVGFNGLYVNRKGREQKGIVEESKEEKLIEEVTRRLLALKDEKTGKSVVQTVYRGRDIYSKEYRDLGPDLVVGFAPGYRASWRSVLARADGPVLEDNMSPWSGDHLIDPKAVPGILLCSEKLAQANADLTDIAPTILGVFGVKPPPEMKGHSLLKGGSN